MRLHYVSLQRVIYHSLIVLFLIISPTFAKNKSDNANSACHQIHKPAIASQYVSKVANLWTVLTNYGFIGNQIYEYPSFEWPGGSGNHHMY
jgi:hypothetical protein